MSEAPEVLAFHRAVYLRAAETRLGELEKNRWNFLASSLYEGALDLNQWCHLAGRWEYVLRYMSALEKYLHWQGRWAEASQHVEYALEAARHLDDARARAHWTFYAGLIQDEQGHFQEARLRYSESLLLARAASEVGDQAEAWRRLGWLAHVEKDPALAEAHYHRAVDLHRQIDDHLGRARDHRQLGLLALERGRYGRARRHLQVSLRLGERGTTPEAWRLQAAVYLDLGVLALRQGKLDQADQQLRQALNWSEAAQDPLLQADIRSYLGTVAEEQGDWETAAQHYRRRRSLARESGDRRGEASALNALGGMFLINKDYDQARHCFEEALIGDDYNRAVAVAQLGTLDYLQGSYREALERLQAALSSFGQLDRQQEMAGCYQQLGLVAQALERWQEAEKYYQASLEIRSRLGLAHEVVLSLNHLGRLAQETGQYEKARRFYHEALQAGKRSDPRN